MEKEIEMLKAEIQELKKELETRPTTEQVEKMIAEYVFNNVPMR